MWHVAIFGSAARGNDHDASDVDLLLDLDSSARIGLVQLAAIHSAIETELERSVDVMTRGGLRMDRHADILEDLYEVFRSSSTRPRPLDAS